MKISRHYTTPNQAPYAEIEFRRSKSEIRNPDGSMVFSLDEVEVPSNWSQVATDILAQKYFRRAGVPARVRRVEEDGVPSFLWRSEADTAELATLPVAARYGSEHSAIQVFDRLAGAWTYGLALV
jgi:ribonucleoside-diphosphate reductase alpha chain